MHLLVAKAGGYADETAVIALQQTPADIVVLSAADTDLAVLANQAKKFAQIGSLRLANLGHLRNHASIDLYINETIGRSRVVVATLLGGVSYWQYLVDRLLEITKHKQIKLVLLSGTDQFDEQLAQLSNQSSKICHELWRYQRQGGVDNARSFLAYIFDQCLAIKLPESVDWQAPKALPKTLLYQPNIGMVDYQTLIRSWHKDKPNVFILFYKAHYQSANLQVIDQLINSLISQGLNSLPIALNSLKDEECMGVINKLMIQSQPALIINTTSFAISDPGKLQDENWSAFANRIPVLQVIFSSGDIQDWQDEFAGLSPRDLAMHVVLPELDGRIITRAVSFKGEISYSKQSQVSISGYKPHHERINWVSQFAKKMANLSLKKNQHKKIALVLANYPTKEGRIGNGVGLDTPASTVNILNSLQACGYELEGIPKTGNDLINRLLEGTTNDIDMLSVRSHNQWLNVDQYETYFSQIDQSLQNQLLERWGEPVDDPMVVEGAFCIAGFKFGNVFVGIQPARGYHLDLNASYHDPDLIPPHAYLAYYFWLRFEYQMDAIVHVGKHGNLEWLPGKSLALSNQCWPDVILGPIPHFYPFIVNDPGEGAQAKRRAQAVIIDHLMPPLMRAENYGELVELENMVDEYYDAISLDPARSTILRKQILDKCQQQHIIEEFHAIKNKGEDAAPDEILNKLDAYLCELKESQIRDGLHIFGESPLDQSRATTLLAVSRLPIGDGKSQNQSLIKALALDFGFDPAFDPLICDMSLPWDDHRPQALVDCVDAKWRTNGDTRERLEAYALQLLMTKSSPELMENFDQAGPVIKRIQTRVSIALDKCGHNEIANLIDGLAGKFVPPGPSGAPSRGRVDVLPTGRNFFSVDVRAVPTPTAWIIGFKSASHLIERYVQDHGDYPKSIGISVWGTATMRTGGDDIAQAMALLGVKPKWAVGSNRVQDFEIIPLSTLGRPRVDVTLRVSGFFRDAFLNVIRYFDAVVQKVAEQEEDEFMNPIRARMNLETDELVQKGLNDDDARKQAGWRVFGAKPGAYGAGLQGLIDERIWDDRANLAQAYTNWGGYAYGQNDQGTDAVPSFVKRLSLIDAVHQNQDNREHDILDSDDYYQFQGGMTGAVEHYRGEGVAVYHGDTSNPENPKIRSLKEEISRVIRSRVVNPKWLKSIQKHGYKGAFELSATVDYLFAYDATTNVVEDYQYNMIAQAYLMDDEIKEFLSENNPHALKEMSERFLEAMDRQMWQQPGDMRDNIESILIDVENLLEK